MLNTNKELKWYILLYYNFFVYLPVLVLLSLIFLIYFGYYFIYLDVLINADQYDLITFPFGMTTEISEAHDKGIYLLIYTTTFFILLVISILRTVFMNPGYFNDVFNIEHKIVLSQSINKKHNKDPIMIKSADEIIIENMNKVVKEVDSDIESETSKHYKKVRKNKNLSVTLNTSYALNISVLNEADADTTIQKDGNMKKKNCIDIDKYQLDDRIEFMNDFNEIISSGPLNHKEQEEFLKKINFFMKEDKEEDKRKNKEKEKEKDSIDEDDNQSIPESTISETLKNISSLSSKNLNSYFQKIELKKAMLCGTCLRYKIERSHHCRQCGKCVLKMDHHCPWLANCIGFRNYKFFLLIEFHGVLTSIPIILTFWEAVIAYHISVESSLFICWFVCFLYFCVFSLFIFLVWLTIINWKLVLTGQTVIENSDRERFPLNKNINIYDLGILKNFITVFGTNPLIWFLPISPNYKGEGIYFETIYNKMNKNEMI